MNFAESITEFMLKNRIKEQKALCMFLPHNRFNTRENREVF